MAYTYYVSFKGKKQGQLKGASTKSAGSSPVDHSSGETFEIDDFSFDIEQILNNGSRSSGGGTGKVTFNPFQITKKNDSASPRLFQECCTGEVFDQVVLQIVRPGKGGAETVVNRITLTNATVSHVFPIAIYGKPHHKYSFGFENISVDLLTPDLIALARG